MLLFAPFYINKTNEAIIETFDPVYPGGRNPASFKSIAVQITQVK
jgi:hypothetical protein